MICMDKNSEMPFLEVANSLECTFLDLSLLVFCKIYALVFLEPYPTRLVFGGGNGGP